MIYFLTLHHKTLEQSHLSFFIKKTWNFTKLFVKTPIIIVDPDYDKKDHPPWLKTEIKQWYSKENSITASTLTITLGTSKTKTHLLFPSKTEKDARIIWKNTNPALRSYKGKIDQTIFHFFIFCHELGHCLEPENKNWTRQQQEIFADCLAYRLTQKIFPKDSKKTLESILLNRAISYLKGPENYWTYPSLKKLKNSPCEKSYSDLYKKCISITEDITIQSIVEKTKNLKKEIYKNKNKLIHKYYDDSLYAFLKTKKNLNQEEKMILEAYQKMFLESY